jgi:hypothetical protein
MKVISQWANDANQMIIQLYDSGLFSIYQEPDFIRYFFVEEDGDLIVLEPSENDWKKDEEK